MNVSTERRFVPGKAVAAQPKGPVRLRFIENPNGAGDALEIGVDYEKAEVPDRRYYADYCRVIQGRCSLNLIFGRLVPGENALRTQVEIAFPETLFVRQLWNGSRAFHAHLEKEFASANMAAVGNLPQTDKVQGFRANNVFMATIGDDSILDFYYIAPPDIHFVRAGKRSDVTLEPIIRIALPAVVLLDFLEQCRPHAEKSKYAGDEHDNDED